MLGNEKEVLFAAGATLTLLSETKIRDDYTAGKYNCPEKQIPVYVVEVNIS
jgi:hypothetical protein